MKTKFIEATNGEFNWGKFMIVQFEEAEWALRSQLDDRPLFRGRGWGPEHFWIVDLATGEGAIFRHGGSARADLDKHAIWVCPLFEPFLTWFYRQDVRDLGALPELVQFTLEEAPFAMAGHRRAGAQREVGAKTAHCNECGSVVLAEDGEK